MINFQSKSILVPYDFSKNADYALNYAVSFSKKTGAVVHLAYIQKKSDLLNLFLPKLKKNADKEFYDFLVSKLADVNIKLKKEHGVEAKVIVKTGNIINELVEITKDFKVDLIVMGTRGKDSTSDLFFGSNAYRLITKSTVPVMTLTNKPKNETVKSILLPIDFSDHSRQKINYAIGMAKFYKAKIYALGLYEENEKADHFKLETYCKQIEKYCQTNKVAFEFSVEKTKHRAKKTLAHSKRIEADIIITMTDEKIEVNKGITSSFDHEIVNHSKIPVISIAPEIGKKFNSVNVGLPF